MENDEELGGDAVANQRNQWRVAPRSGFRTAAVGGSVGLIQITPTTFEVANGFHFEGEAAADIERRLVGDGVDGAEARRRVDEARTFTPRAENPTDLASVPAFMRWFANSYGLHTLAAILHDDLILPKPNTGALGSDVLADRFFREMLRSAGVPWLKRWVMWTAVAMRTRWMAGGKRRIQLVVWVIAAVVGITSFLVAAGSWADLWDLGISPSLLLAVALGLPFAAALLWGEQIGAGLIATVAALWVLPAAGFAIVGLCVYRALERVARSFGLT